MRQIADGRASVATVLACTAVLALGAAFGGHAVGRQVAQSEPGRSDAPSSPAASATPAPTAADRTAPSPATTGRPTELSDQARATAASASVRLTHPGSGFYGSGSVISSDGLVLTNAHVAVPLAPGLPLSYGQEVRETTEYPYVSVSTNPPDDGPAVPTYRADVLAVDGYLDLAVLKIVALADGSDLPQDLDLPFVPTGTVRDLRKGDDLTVYGFPSVTGGEVLSVTPGSVRTFLPDALGRVQLPRYTVETTADISAGNSGGMALDNAGALVGVPSGRRPRKDLAVARYVRAVDVATPLVQAAAAGQRYTSPYLTPPTGSEQADAQGWQADDLPCGDEGVQELAGPVPSLVGQVVLTGMAKGEDLLRVLRRDGQTVRVVASAWWGESGPGCLTTEVSAADLGGGDAVPAGTYELDVLAGPDRRLLVTSRVTVRPSDG